MNNFNAIFKEKMEGMNEKDKLRFDKLSDRAVMKALKHSFNNMLDCEFVKTGRDIVFIFVFENNSDICTFYSHHQWSKNA